MNPRKILSFFWLDGRTRLPLVPDQASSSLTQGVLRYLLETLDSMPGEAIFAASVPEQCVQLMRFETLDTGKAVLVRGRHVAHGLPAQRFGIEEILSDKSGFQFWRKHDAVVQKPPTFEFYPRRVTLLKQPVLFFSQKLASTHDGTCLRPMTF
jgi:hypothetical protein